MQTMIVYRSILLLVVMECIFCTKPLDNGQSTTKLREKGCETINQVSERRESLIITTPGQVVHTACRRDYVNPNTPANTQTLNSSPIDSRSLRSKIPDFNFQENCLYCGHHAKLNDRKRGLDVYPVRTVEFNETVRQICQTRKDEWATEVLGRLNITPSDLHASDAVYHHQCCVNFSTHRQKPKAYNTYDKDRITSTPGRPKNSKTEQAFLQVVEGLEEKDTEQMTVTDLVTEMKHICGDEAFSTVYMKKRLIDYFGKSIIISSVNGQPNVITFQHTASEILYQFYKHPKIDDPEEQKKSIIQTAAKLIKSDIKTLSSSFKQEYPSAEFISSVTKNTEFVPSSLQIFLGQIFGQADSALKVASIGQAIIQACRPRTLIAPLQIGLGVQMHHQFSSRFLVDTLNSLGFSSSYTEIQKFEMNAAIANGKEDTLISDTSKDSFIQYVADNVDHNIRTLDGHGTFHGMGIIAAVTPGSAKMTPVLRESPTSEEVSNLACVNIKPYKNHHGILKELKYEVVSDFVSPGNDEISKIDLLCRISWSNKTLCPSWSATMHKVLHGNYPGKSAVFFLPIIDMNPSDLTCIYSTLHFVCKEAFKNNATPMLTFDQPLYWKAKTVIENEPTDSNLKSMILRLGGFHAEMSYVGSIGYIMAGTGFSQLLETVYAPTTVSHMITGKAIARAVRGYFLVHSALTTNILSKIYCEDVSENNIDSEDANDLAGATKLFESLLHETKSIVEVCVNPIFDNINSKMEQFRSSRKDCRTSILWFQFMDMVQILKTFIRAERTGDWNLHLQSIKDMLPYLAAAGHNLYVKSARLYLQDMNALPQIHPDVHSYLLRGHHVIRRSEKYWCGLSSDLAIEQILMRSIKTSGGLTRGRGMSDHQRAQWALSMPYCAEYNHGIQELTSSNFVTSDQHKEEGESRRKRDSDDIQTLADFIDVGDPFIADKNFRNIETGVTADSKVNADKAKEVGMKILESMNGVNVENYKFKRNKQVVQMSENACFKIKDDNIQVDPQLLFQRFIAAADDICEDKSEIFTYELSSFPSSMFESSGMMRMAQKSNLLDAIWNLGDCMAEPIANQEIRHVIDGGSLLHRVQWQRGSTFGQICQGYIDCVRLSYNDCVVVFDGYNSGPDTKDAIHLRRSRGIIGTKVNFTEDTIFRSKKDMFLANKTNKENFINLLISRMSEHGVEAKKSESDADVLIALTAVSTSSTKPTVLIGEDTDLLVLPAYHIDLRISKPLYFRSDTRGKQKVWDLKKTKTLLGEEVCKILPVIHAISGCDTTSRLFGISKAATVKKISESEFLKSQSQVFLLESTQDKVIAAGEHLVSALYGGAVHEKLDHLRYRKFTNRVLKNKSSVPIHSIPPTSTAASFHSLRTYLQVQIWLNRCELNPCEWGWLNHNGMLMPITTSRPAAPASLLQVISCQCKTNCDTRRCSCRKHGLSCSPICKDCRGLSCNNLPNPIEEQND